MQIFRSEEFGELQTLTIDDGVWFVGKEVAEKLAYRDTDQAVRRHVDSEDKLTRNFDGSGQNRPMTIINESGLYSLILSSKLPTAKRFKRWVTGEVLPSIRKTGGYQLQPVFSPAPVPTKRKFHETDYVTALAESYLDAHVVQILAGRSVIASEALYDGYVQWASEMGVEILTSRQFFKVVRTKYFYARQSRRKVDGKSVGVYSHLDWRVGGPDPDAELRTLALILEDLCGKTSVALNRWNILQSVTSERLRLN